MQAIVQEAYGAPADVLELCEIEQPEPGDDEVLVRVRASSVHPDVWHAVTGVPYVLRLMGAGFRAPVQKVPGIDVAGVVESVGKRVTQFEPGDEVFGETVGGYQWKNGGAYAEFVAVAADALVRKPANVTFEQAASVPTSGLIALQNLRGYNLQSGQRVLINGAAGNVGSLAVQIAKAWGAEVTAVDRASKLDRLRSLGADHVIDYLDEDFTQGSERYDLILDVASTLTLASCKRVLTPSGVYVLIGHDHFGQAKGRWLGSVPRALGLVLWSAVDTHVAGMRSHAAPASEPPQRVLAELLGAGKITPIIDRVFALPEVPSAMAYMVEGRANGRIAVRV